MNYNIAIGGKEYIISIANIPVFSESDVVDVEYFTEEAIYEYSVGLIYEYRLKQDGKRAEYLPNYGESAVITYKGICYDEKEFLQEIFKLNEFNFLNSISGFEWDWDRDQIKVYCTVYISIPQADYKLESEFRKAVENKEFSLNKSKEIKMSEHPNEERQAYEDIKKCYSIGADILIEKAKSDPSMCRDIRIALNLLRAGLTRSKKYFSIYNEDEIFALIDYKQKALNDIESVNKGNN